MEEVQVSSIEEDLKDMQTNTESDFSKVVEHLLNNKWKRRKTILSNKQVAALTTLDVISQMYDIDFLKMFVKSYAEWRTSGDNGKGRNDIVEISKYKHEEDAHKHEEVMEMLRGR